MGYKDSPYAVVDSELKVMGVNNLRVVDASVQPTIVGAPTQASTIMIAEKASHLILTKWGHDASNYDDQQYGPPPLPQKYGPTTTEEGYTSTSTVSESPNSIVVDDSIGGLTPPGIKIYFK
jgi:hypothetical protein